MALRNIQLLVLLSIWWSEGYDSDVAVMSKMTLVSKISLYLFLRGVIIVILISDLRWFIATSRHEEKRTSPCKKKQKSTKNKNVCNTLHQLHFRLVIYFPLFIMLIIQEILKKSITKHVMSFFNLKTSIHPYTSYHVSVYLKLT